MLLTASILFVSLCAPALQDASAPAPSSAPGAPAAAVASLPLVPWQRDLDDALAMVKATGKPLLICVNMDGEAASDALAESRYHDPGFARLASGFIPLIVSPDRHRARDRDDFGRRLPDPRFGRVLCSEHIDEEPALFRRYFDGNRVAPRHVGIAPDGTKLFDLSLLNDLSVIDAALEKNGVITGQGQDPATLDDDALLASPDAACRGQLEARFHRAAPAVRASLAENALSNSRETQQPELIRMALRDEDRHVRGAAVHAIAAHLQQVARGPFEFLSEAFRAAGADEAANRELIDAVLAPNAFPADSPIARNARTLARGAAALALSSRWLDVEAWKKALAAAPAANAPETSETPGTLDAPNASDSPGPPDPNEVEANVEKLLAARANDPRVHVDATRILLDAARAIVAADGDPGGLFEDARSQARAACDVAAPEPIALALLSDVSQELGDTETAATCAARALPGLLDHAADPVVARVLRAFSAARTASLFDALRADREWPATWLSDLRAAGEVLLLHPFATDDDAIQFLSLLNEMDARALEGDVVRRAARRFPLSGRVHEYVRFVVLRDEGAAALERVYADIPAPKGHGPELDWYRALATLVAGQRHEEDGRIADALAADHHAALRFQECSRLDPTITESALHYACHAFAAEATLLADAGRLDEALATMSSALAIDSDGLSAADDAGKTPIARARVLAEQLRGAGRDADAEQLEARVKAIH